mgnify:CR=1 FL=1
MKLSDAIWKYLKAQGVDTVYMPPGGGAMHLVDSLGQSGINVVPMLHEQGAGYAAMGHAMMTGKTAVCLVTSGPGATNAVTPCANAWVDSVPVLFISGQAPSTMLADGQRCRGPQEIDITSMVMDVTKYAHESDDPKVIMYWLDVMFREVMIGRPGPCWLSIPLDVQAMEV